MGEAASHKDDRIGLQKSAKNIKGIYNYLRAKLWYAKKVEKSNRKRIKKRIREREAYAIDYPNHKVKRRGLWMDLI